MKVFSGIFITFICFLSICFTSVKSSAYTPKEGNVTAIFGPFFHRTNIQPLQPHTDSPRQAGYGLIANGDANDRESLEIAMFFIPKIFMQSRDGKFVAEETQLLHITMGYKRWLSEIWAVSLALFSSYSMGEVNVVSNDFAPGDQPLTSARDTTEYGLDLAFQYEIWQKDRFGIVADARYSRSLTPKAGEAADHYGVLVGLRYFIQEKQKE